MSVLVPKLTHPQRAVQRLHMAESLASGRTLEGVAAGFGVSTDTVRSAAREHQVVFQTAGMVGRRERHRKLALLVAEGQSVKDVARAGGFSVFTVYLACRENGVTTPGLTLAGKLAKAAHLAVVPLAEWSHVDWTQNNAVIARRLGVSRERVRVKRGQKSAGMV